MRAYGGCSLLLTPLVQPLALPPWISRRPMVVTDLPSRICAAKPWTSLVSCDSNQPIMFDPSPVPGDDGRQWLFYETEVLQERACGATDVCAVCQPGCFGRVAIPEVAGPLEVRTMRRSERLQACVCVVAIYSGISSAWHVARVSAAASMHRCLRCVRRAIAAFGCAIRE